ncbi:MAG: glycoside hydrolase family 13 protein [Sedimentibacter sp.]|jgi:glycosidase|nr:glycoside hydrolase family 13 protein [Tissierellia bacterium]MDD4045516.1 glycoside hydrolase family 13 protein [Tissierellia bacterium]
MYKFDSQSEFYRYPQGGIKSNEIITFKILVKRNICTPELLIEKRNDYDRAFYNKVKMHWISREKNYDIYQVMFSIKEYGHYYYSFIFDVEKSKDYELLIYDEHYSTPNWAKGGIIYHIFVDRFFRYQIIKKKGAIIRNWGETPNYLPDKKGEVLNNDFFGGNLDGITEKLPYIAKLGVSIIYLSPIFEAYSNHKYDTGNYLKIDPMFGTENSLKKLIQEAEKYGIHVILDGVFSHTGDDSIYFNKYGRYDSIGAYESKDSPYYDWYTFNNWNDDYVSWWGIKTLPEVNESNGSYVDFITGKNGVIQHWQKVGVMGWRLDVADELPDEFIIALRNSIKNNNDSLIIGEVWEDASNKYSYNKLKEYFCGKQLDSVTNYPIRDGIIEYVKNKDCTLLYQTMNKIMETYPPDTVNCLMNIIGTHDTERILTILGSDTITTTKEEMAESILSDEELIHGIKMLKIASLLQFTLPGIPCIYYGDEAGMEGWKDPFNRRCYPWGNENKEILNHYIYLANLRKNNDLFKDEKYKCLIHDKGVFVFERFDDNKKLIIAVNLSSKEITLKLREDMTEYKNNIKNNIFIIEKEGSLILRSLSHPERKRRIPGKR